MGRRIFYASGPYDVVSGFLCLLLFGGLVALCAQGGGGQAYILVKALGLALAGASTMLYRERVVADPRYRTLEVTRSLFVLPFSRLRADFQEVRSVRWKRVSGAWGGSLGLMLELAGGREYLLSRKAQPDPALAAEVREFFGLPDNPDHNLPPPPPTTPPVRWGRVLGAVLIVLVSIGLVVCVITFYARLGP